MLKDVLVYPLNSLLNGRIDHLLLIINLTVMIVNRSLSEYQKFFPYGCSGMTAKLMFETIFCFLLIELDLS